MNLKAMNLFLSQENIKRHLEHMRTMKLKYSVLEKSVPELKGRDMVEITRSGINRGIKEEALSLLWNIKSHELFFRSFAENPTWPDGMKKHNSSRDKFLYDILCEAKEREYGFLYICTDKQGKAKTYFATEPSGAFVKYEPTLCLDLYEHVYFLDYGYAKEKFIRNALGYFNTARLC